MRIERWEEETDEEWAERLAGEIAIADNTEISKYFVERAPYDETRLIINYIVEKSWTWKEHPEGPFTAKQIIEWKNKAERGEGMNRVGIVKVSNLQGRAKLMAEADGLDPNDLVILTVSLEKIIGDPVSYLLAQVVEE